MSFKNIWSALKKESKVTQEILSSIMLFPDGSIPTPKNYEDYAKLYETVLWVYACIWAIGAHGSMVPYHIYEVSESKDRPDEPDKKELSYNHSARKFFRNPNEVDTFEDIIEAILTFLELNGDCYLEKVFSDRSDELLEIYALRPDRVRIVPRKDGRGIANYIYKIKRWKKGITFDPTEISHFKYFSPNNDFYGQATMMAATKTILLEQYATQFQEMTLRNNAVPQGVIETDYEVDDDEMMRIKKKWIQTHQGINKAGEIAILPLGLKFKPMSYHPRDLEWKNLLENNKERLFSVTGVNNAILGILENMTYDNYRMQVRSFFMSVMQPKMKKIATRITKDILPHFGENLEFAFDFTPFLAEDEAELSSRLQKEVMAGIINRNEAREILKRKRYDGGDTFYIPVNLQPVGSEDSQFMENQNEPEPDDSEDNNKSQPEPNPETKKINTGLDDREIRRRLLQDQQHDIDRGVTNPQDM